MSAIEALLRELTAYGLQAGLLEEADRFFVHNCLLDALQLSEGSPEPAAEAPRPLLPILNDILDWAYANGRLASRYADHADLLDTRLMGCLTPRPSEVNRRFRALCSSSPRQATDWFYSLCQKNHYIRTDRVARNRSWTVATPYGELDITINRSKPEKDPQAIAEALTRPAEDAYPACLLCAENVGYAGRRDHPARQNLRAVPVSLNGEPWYLQYSPYVYYNEHAIIFSQAHVPMAITRDTFVRLLDFVDAYPHYFIGSNADLPVVGGSMLSHDHYQGGRYSFAMERAASAGEFHLKGHPAVTARRLYWPLTVLRLTAADRGCLLEAADHLRRAWEHYSDPACGIEAHSGTERHNTVTPIARRRDGAYELDIVLRNNRRSEAYPDGIFHPHPEIHAVKKENIGLIEVMGLAVLPDRLEDELGALEALLERGAADDPLLTRFSELIRELERETAAGLTLQEALRQAVGRVFLRGLEHCGVFGQHPEGLAGLERFIRYLNDGA